MVNEIIERKKCPFCNSKNIETIFFKNFSEIKLKPFFFKHLINFPIKILKKKNFIISKCTICKAIFQKNILSEKLNKLFYEKYVPQRKSFTKKFKIRKSSENIYDKEYNEIKNFFNKKKINILDFGAGWGFWAIYQRSRGFNVEAYEVSATRVKYLKQKKIKTYQNLSEVKNNFYDVIFLDQVMEHLDKPAKVLMKLKNKLRINGIIIIKVPSGLFTEMKLKFLDYQAKDDELIPFEHINVFNVSVASYLSKISGLGRIYTIEKFNYRNVLYILLKSIYNYITNKKIVYKKNKKIY